MAAFFDYPDPRQVQPSLVSLYDEPEEEEGSEEELELSDHEGDAKFEDLGVSPAFMKSLLMRLNTMYKEEVLCDYTLVAGYESVKVHKVVLAMHSDYFKAMFTLGMRESDQNRVQLKGVSAYGLKAIVEYMYTGQLEIHKYCVEDILGAANHLQVTEVVTMCRNFLKKELQRKSDSLVLITNLADLYSYWDIHERAFTRLMQCIDEVLKSGEFKKLAPAVLGRILESQVLDKCVEEEYLGLLCEWVEDNKRERLQHLAQFLDSIRYCLIPYPKLLELANKFPFLQKEPKYHEIMVKNKQYHGLDILERVFNQTPATKVRGEPTIVTFCGQDSIGNYTSENLFVLHRQPKREEWIRACNTPDSFCDAGVGALENFMFVCGGYNPFDGVTKNCHVFDPRSFQWEVIAPMKDPRSRFPVVGLGKHLYVFGGQGRQFCLSAVERFSPEKNEWRRIGDMPQRFRRHAACVLNDEIYMCGGERPKLLHSTGIEKGSCVVSNGIWKFNPKNGKFKELNHMPRPLAGHSLYPKPDSNSLLVISGELDKIVDVFDTQAEQWSQLNLTTFVMDIVQGFMPITNARAVFVGGSIYFVNNVSHRCVRYDLFSAKYHLLKEKYPDDVGNYVQTCVLTVPIPRLLGAV